MPLALIFSVPSPHCGRASANDEKQQRSPVQQAKQQPRSRLGQAGDALHQLHRRKHQRRLPA